ncbi:MAG: zinc ribbon domain-containing protein [Armatimonadetes bacterium]|nr:zinc ribbon domain-containing protein [Armatimonadota bacterium]
MPLYEYRCEECHALFSELQPMSAPRTGTPCPRCGSRKTRRAVSTFASKPADPGSASSGGACLPGG